MTSARTFAAALAVALSLPGSASAQQGPFAPTELSYEEAWKLACWDKAEFQMVANDCTQGGRYMLDSSEPLGISFSTNCAPLVNDALIRLITDAVR